MVYQMDQAMMYQMDQAPLLRMESLLLDGPGSSAQDGSPALARTPHTAPPGAGILGLDPRPRAPSGVLGILRRIRSLSSLAGHSPPACAGAKSSLARLLRSQGAHKHARAHNMAVVRLRRHPGPGSAVVRSPPERGMSRGEGVSEGKELAFTHDSRAIIT